jgi:hypothetical protein
VPHGASHSRGRPGRRPTHHELGSANGSRTNSPPSAVGGAAPEGPPLPRRGSPSGLASCMVSARRRRDPSGAWASDENQRSRSGSAPCRSARGPRPRGRPPGRMWRRPGRRRHPAAWPAHAADRCALEPRRRRDPRGARGALRLPGSPWTGTRSPWRDPGRPGFPPTAATGCRSPGPPARRCRWAAGRRSHRSSRRWTSPPSGSRT